MCGELQNRARETPIFWKKSTSHCSNMCLMSIGWENGYKMTGCEHADLPQDDQTLWLVKDSYEYNVLEKIMMDKQFVTDVRKLRQFCSHLSA